MPGKYCLANIERDYQNQVLIVGHKPQGSAKTILKACLRGFTKILNLSKKLAFEITKRTLKLR
ncbi:MAG: hypothetical protein Kow00121_24580 [Elainellaceae cyanobacterium]